MAAPHARTQVNSATGIMGPSGTGKSSLLATLAKMVYRKWGKVSLYYNSDGGGFPAEMQACIAAGIVKVFRMPTRDPGHLGLSFETCQRACQGWWPRRINPSTGEVEPGVEMVPPVSLAYEMRCPEGHLVRRVPAEALLTPTVCPSCKSMVTKLTMQVTKVSAPTRGFEQVGAVMFDGLSSMLAWEMRELGHRAGRLEIKGEEGSLGGKITSGDIKFGSSNRAHYGFVQARAEELVHLTLGIPNLVVPPVFTMLTHEDVDDRSLSIRGPKIMGRAKTDEAPQWFGNLLEAAKIPALQGNGEQRVLYLEEFTDKDGIRHLCKHRGSPGTMPAMLMDPPEDKAHPELAFTGFNLGLFFEMLDSALTSRIEQVMAEFPDAPGVPEGIVEIGGMGMAGAAPMPTPPTPGTAPAVAKKRVVAVPAPVPTPPIVEGAAPGVAPIAEPEPTLDFTEPVVPAVRAPVPATTPVPAPRPALAAPAGRRPGTPAGIPIRGVAPRPSGPTPLAPGGAPRPTLI